jgi:hypothetical protein
MLLHLIFLISLHALNGFEQDTQLTRYVIWEDGHSHQPLDRAAGLQLLARRPRKPIEIELYEQD